jgi:hypothetical protein
MIRVKLVEVVPPEPDEQLLGWLDFPCEPPQQGLLMINGEIVGIIGTRWEVEISDLPKEPYMLLVIARPQAIARPQPPGLIDPSGRRLM